MSIMKRLSTFGVAGCSAILAMGLFAGCGSKSSSAIATTTTTVASSSTTASIDTSGDGLSSGLSTTTTLPPAGSIDCGVITIFGGQERLVVVSGTTCDQAKVVAAGYSKGLTFVPTGWACSLGRAGESEDYRCGSTDSSNKVFILRNPSAPVS